MPTTNIGNRTTIEANYLYAELCPDVECRQVSIGCKPELHIGPLIRVLILWYTCNRCTLPTLRCGRKWILPPKRNKLGHDIHDGLRAIPTSSHVVSVTAVLQYPTTHPAARRFAVLFVGLYVSKSTLPSWFRLRIPKGIWRENMKTKKPKNNTETYILTYLHILGISGDSWSSYHKTYSISQSWHIHKCHRRGRCCC